MGGRRRPLRLCFIADPNSVHTARWLRYFVEAGHDVHLIPDREPRRGIEGVRLHPVWPLWRVPKLRFGLWGIQARRRVARIAPDILHSLQAISAGWIGAMTGFHPYAITPLGSDLLLFPERSGLNRRLTELTLGRADLVIGVSQEMRRKAAALGAKRTEYARWGADLDEFRPGRDVTALRQALGLEDDPVVLSARGMRPIYNQTTVAGAIPGVLERVPGARFLFWEYAVDEDYRERVRALVAALKVATRVRFLEPVAEYERMADYYCLADVTVSVASSDSIPLTMLESMACGTPVVMGDLPSVRESVTDGENGLLVPVGDAGATAEAIVRVLEDGRLRRRLIRRGLEYAREHGDHRKWMGRVEELYYELAGDG